MSIGNWFQYDFSRRVSPDAKGLERCDVEGVIKFIKFAHRTHPILARYRIVRKPIHLNLDKDDQVLEATFRLLSEEGDRSKSSASLEFLGSEEGKDGFDSVPRLTMVVTPINGPQQVIDIASIKVGKYNLYS